jgi:chromosome partitioning protein
MTITIAVLSQKGGTGKTTTVRTLTDVLRRCGVSTLAVDLDPQGNLSEYFDLPPDVEPTIAEVLAGRATAVEAVHEDIVPANLSLAEAELALGGKMGRELTLRRALGKGLDEYDVILIDCPPSLGLLTLNGLVAADAVLVPLQCEFYALEGLSHLVRTIERVKRHLNPGLEIQGVVLTMFDKRNNLSDLVAADVRDHFGDKVYETVIPRNVRISEAPSHGTPVLLYDFRCPGSQAYVHLAGEVLRRERKRPKAAPSAA